MRKLAILLLCLVISLIATAFPSAKAASCRVEIEPIGITKLGPGLYELGPENVVGKNFTVKVNLYDVTGLYGADVQIKWTTKYIRYVTHTMMIPVETHPGGVLHQPVMPIHDDVDEDASMIGSAPGTMYWLSQASMSPAAVFDGNGTFAVFNFTVVQQPDYTDSDAFINFTYVLMGTKTGSPITHTKVNAHIILHGKPQPPGPTLEIIPETYTYKGEIPHTFTANVSISNLDAYWDLGGFDLQVSYDPRFIQANAVLIDPDGWYASFWPNGFLAIVNQTDNVEGKVWIAVVGLPGVEGHTPPYGNATLFTITFEAIMPGQSLTLEIITEPPRYLASFPHPERPEEPFGGRQSSVPMPYYAEDGSIEILNLIHHSIMAAGNEYIVTTESNSSVSEIFFEDGISMLYFNVTGIEGFTGFFNITIPLDFMWSTLENGWLVFVDGQLVTPQIYMDTENTYIYLTYQHSIHHITIVTTNVIPEFHVLALIIFMAAISIILTKIFVKKKT